MLKKFVIAALKTKAIDLLAKAIDLEVIKIWPRDTSWSGLVLRTTLMAEAGTDEPAYARGWCFSIGS